MLLGLQSGIVDPIINIPIVISISISASLLPNLAKAYASGEKLEVKALIEKAMQITLSVSLVCAISFVIFGKQILMFLYGASLDKSQLLVSTKLLFLGGINLLFLSLVQVSSGILHGMGKQVFTVKTLLVGSVIKIILTIILVSVKNINILGAMVSGGISYLVVFVLNYKQIQKESLARLSNVMFGVVVQSCFVCLFAYFSNMLFKMVLGGSVALFAGGIVSVIIFLVTYYTLFLMDKTQRISS